MSILIKNGNLVITHDSRCSDVELLNTVLEMRVRFPDCLSFFNTEIEQYLARRFPDYLFKFRNEFKCKDKLEFGQHSNNLEVDKYVYNYGANFVETYYNLFLLEVWENRKFIVENETKGLVSYLGFKLMPDGEYYKFIELEDCYMSIEEKKQIKWWEVNHAN